MFSTEQIYHVLKIALPSDISFFSCGTLNASSLSAVVSAGLSPVANIGSSKSFTSDLIISLTAWPSNVMHTNTAGSRDIPRFLLGVSYIK
jgi:hypothetical protein